MLETTEMKESKIVSSVRDSIRNNVNVSRLKHRQEGVDSLRVAPNDLQNFSINLQTFSEDDVSELVKTIKKNKHAQPTELLKLSHAFLQSTQNINCFVKKIGAMNVLIKELTGPDSERQILATECLCNLSLGSEYLSEKVALQAGTYLHTFLQSPNIELMRTSIWCFTNLIATGTKPLTVLLNQKLVTSLVNLNKSTHDDQIKKESYTAIELVIEHSEKNTFRTSDLESLSGWIISQNAPIDADLTMIIYKLLNKLEFQSNDASATQTLLTICFDTLVQLNEQSDAHQIILLVRICSNIVSLERHLGSFIFENWFCASKRSFSVFFNQILQIVRANNLSVNEIYWFINNLVSTSEDEAKFTNELLANLEIAP